MVKEAEKLIAKIDPDGDGQVTKAEFKQFWGTLFDKTKGNKGGNVGAESASSGSSGSSSSDSNSDGESTVGDDIIGDAKDRVDAMKFAD